MSDTRRIKKIIKDQSRKFRRTVGFVGDSNSRIGNSVVSGFNQWNLQGWPSWLRILSKQSIKTSKDYIFAVNGATVNTIIDDGYLKSATQAGLDVYIVSLGVNDCQGLSVATYRNKLNYIVDALTDTGAVVLLQTIHPNTEATATEMKILHQMNVVIREISETTSNVILSDVVPYLIAATATDGSPATGYLYDSVHFANKGAYLVAKKHWEILSTIVPPYEKRFFNPSDVYATDNPGGNLLSNGILAGTAGTYEAAVGITGNIADNWNLVMNLNANVGSVTCTASKVARTDGYAGEWQKLVFTGTPGNSASLQYIFQKNITTNFSAGDIIELVAEFKVTSGSTGIQAVFAQIYDATVTPNVGCFDGASSSGHTLYTGDTIHGVLATEPYLVTKNSGTIQMNIGVQTYNTEVTGDVYLGPISLRKI